MRANRRTILQRTGIVGTGLLAGSGAVGAVTADGDDTDADDDIEDAEDARLEGTITDFGVPVADATVTVTDGSEETSVDTDEDGSYAMDLEPGRYVLGATGDGYGDVTGEVEVGADETETVDLALEREWGPGEGELEVFATGVGGGRTIPCEVTVYGDETYATPAPLGSVPDGENWNKGFAVSEGWWEVRVSNAAGYADGYANVYVEDGDETVATVELRDLDQLEDDEDGEIESVGRFTGTVTDESGDPIEGATVAVDGRRTSTDEDGTFELELDHGRHDVVVDASGYERSTGRVTVRFARETSTTLALAAPQS